MGSLNSSQGSPTEAPLPSGKWWCSRKKRQRNETVTPAPPLLIPGFTSWVKVIFLWSSVLRLQQGCGVTILYPIRRKAKTMVFTMFQFSRMDKKSRNTTEFFKIFSSHLGSTGTSIHTEDTVPFYFSCSVPVSSSGPTRLQKGTTNTRYKTAVRTCGHQITCAQE